MANVANDICGNSFFFFCGSPFIAAIRQLEKCKLDANLTECVLSNGIVIDKKDGFPPL
jgi:hypothetical protein